MRTFVFSILVLLLAGAGDPSAAQDRYFTIYHGYDLFGGDYRRLPGRVPYDACLSACQADLRCNAFTYNSNASACFLKSQVPYIQSFAGAISGVLSHLEQPDSPPPAGPQPAGGACGSGFTTFDNADFFGNDLAGHDVDFSTCRQYCLNNGSCRGFSWIKTAAAKRCWLKFNLPATTVNYKVISCARH